MKHPITRTLLLALAIALVGGCKKEASIPTVTTGEVAEVTQNAAVAKGTLVDDGGAPINSQGLCWSTDPSPSVANSKTEKTKLYYINFYLIEGLTASTTYHVRAYATNSAGTGYGNEVVFTTLPAVLPEVTSAYPQSISHTTALCGGEITFDGGTPITARGLCWGASENPTVADGKTEDGQGQGVFQSSLTGLTASTTYYVRAYATNEVGTAYGGAMVVRTMKGTVTDVDGNAYYTVVIGSQEWMAENLKVTHYRNGDAIPNITVAAEWVVNTSSGAWCSYDNDPANKNTYGLLYNHYTVADSRGVCPDGWHVPSDADWTTLTDYLGGEAIAGYKLKKAGEGVDADNSSGFTALMGGYREYYQGSFYYINSEGQWWSSTSASFEASMVRVIKKGAKRIQRVGDIKWAGNSIRCLKD